MGLIIALAGISAATLRPVQGSAVWMAEESKQVSEQLGVSMEEARKLVEKDHSGRTQGVQPVVSLLGTLPLAVGLAYLVFYYTDDSRKKTRLPAPSE